MSILANDNRKQSTPNRLNIAMLMKGTRDIEAPGFINKSIASFAIPSICKVNDEDKMILLAQSKNRVNLIFKEISNIPIISL